MFTGIIEEVGQLLDTIDIGEGRRLRIATRLGPELMLGQSVAVNGVCLTVTAHTDNTFEVTVIPETLRKTTLGQLLPGTPLNLERALKIGARLDGHIVQGHIDAACPITQIQQTDNERLYTLTLPAAFAGFVINTGSIAIDGISLTVARLHGLRLTVAIIPYTYAHTNVQEWATGTRCNVEFDLIGKYAARQLSLTTLV